MTIFNALISKYPGAVHALGDKQTDWAKNARLDWSIKESEVAFSTDGKKLSLFKGRKIFYRDDTDEPLSVVGSKFKVVQPKDILDFYGEVAEKHGFKLAIAGEVGGGRKIWAMAETPHSLTLKHGDKVKGGLFVVTACDGSLSTQGYFTSFRLWCSNQLPVVDMHAKRGKTLQVFKCTHGAAFSAQRVEQDLDRMAVGWSDFERFAEALGNKKVTDAQAVGFLGKHFNDPETTLTVGEVDDMKDNEVMKRLFNVYKSGEGQKEVYGTAWGLVNAVTRYLDHETRARDANLRLQKAWIGGARKKSAVFSDALLQFAPKVLQ